MELLEEQIKQHPVHVTQPAISCSNPSPMGLARHISLMLPPAGAVSSPQDYRDLQLLTSWQDQLYAAVCFSVINSVEKVGFA